MEEAIDRLGKLRFSLPPEVEGRRFAACCVASENRSSFVARRVIPVHPRKPASIPLLSPVLLRSASCVTREASDVRKAVAPPACAFILRSHLARGVLRRYNPSMAPEFQHLEQLPLAERLQLVEDLWDSIARNQGQDLPIPEWQQAELDRRRQEYLRNPESARPWSEVKRSILESKG